MKKNFLSASLALGMLWGLALTGTAQTTQYVTLSTSNYPSSAFLAVQTNQIISIVGYDWIDTPSVSAGLSNGYSANLTPWRLIGGTGNGPSLSSQLPQTVTGATSIQVITGYGQGPSWTTFQITTPAAAAVVSNYVPADAIVIPASATGNVQIILESSPDLVNWTAANPGTYGPSAATNRFFRVRAVAN